MDARDVFFLLILLFGFLDCSLTNSRVLILYISYHMIIIKYNKVPNRDVHVHVPA